MRVFEESIARFHSQLFGLIKDKTGRNLPGAGYFLGRVKRTFVARVENRVFVIQPNVARSYGRLAGGSWNEPETHILLGRVLDHLGAIDHFIDVGANVGEFVIDMAVDSRVKRVTAVEPIGELAAALRESISRNECGEVVIRQMLCGATNGFADFYRTRNLSDSFVRWNSDGEAALTHSTVAMVPLDQIVEKHEDKMVLLIDVEGFELEVLRGATDLISGARPLIVFEYNDVSRKVFSLEQMQDLLGRDYSIYRLNKSGWLDKETSRTWNCVALPSHSCFSFLAPER